MQQVGPHRSLEIDYCLSQRLIEADTTVMDALESCAGSGPVGLLLVI